MRKCQSVGKPVSMCYELHGGSSPSLPPGGGAGWLEGSGVRYFLFPTWRARRNWSWVFPCHQAGKALILVKPSRLVSGKIISPKGKTC